MKTHRKGTNDAITDRLARHRELMDKYVSAGLPLEEASQRAFSDLVKQHIANPTARETAAKTELQEATEFAHSVLDAWNSDPDVYLSVLARQFIRSQERETRMRLFLEALAIGDPLALSDIRGNALVALGRAEGGAWSGTGEAWRKTVRNSPPDPEDCA